MTVILFMEWNEEYTFRHVRAVHQTDTDVYILLGDDNDITVNIVDINNMLVLSD